MNPKPKRKKVKNVKVGRDRKFFSRENPFIAPVIFVVIIAIITYTANDWVGYKKLSGKGSILFTPWYWIILASSITIFVVDWVQEKIQLQTAVILLIIVLFLAVPKVVIIDPLWRAALKGNERVSEEVKKQFSVIGCIKWVESWEKTPDTKTGGGADNQNTNKIAGWQESHAFTARGQFWATRHLVAPGDKITLSIKNNPVNIDTGGGNLRRLAPGNYNWPITSGGVLAFISNADQPAEIIVQKH